MPDIRSACIGVGYRRILRPLLFAFDAEAVHNGALWLGEKMGATSYGKKITRVLLSYRHPMLSQTLAGISFSNPIGLAAGFDKDARLISILEDVGFGFAEIGSVTGSPCAGNPLPRLWRLKKSRSLLVHYGLKNDGALAVAQRMRMEHSTIPLGISIARTNTKETISLEAGIADYTTAHRACADVGTFTVVNISCPNMFCDYTFADSARLDALLSSLKTVPTRKPFFIKLSPDTDDTTTDALVAVGLAHGAAGFICSNLTKNRSNPSIQDAHLPAYGGASGKVVDKLSDQLIARVYRMVRGKAIVIGCGGVFSTQDAYRKIRLGASLIELITGMIYEGPQLVGTINRELVTVLKKDGFSSIADAVGADNR
ncbi:MAG: quinone-dependent dihydroorotate dehydrogenase [Candidatus Paceibacterota bacterium]|jgi:dihydroorotate dehydrogenase subfamily 2